MQHFSNYFVQILVIRCNFQGGKDGPGGEKNSSGAAAILLAPPMMPF